MTDLEIIACFPQIVLVGCYYEGKLFDKNGSYMATCITSYGVRQEKDVFQKIQKKFLDPKLCEDAFDFELKKFLTSKIDPTKKYHFHWIKSPALKSYDFIDFIENQENDKIYVRGEFRKCWDKIAYVILTEIN